MSAQDHQERLGKLARGRLLGFNQEPLRDIFRAMTVKDLPAGAKPIVKGRIGTAPSRVIILNGKKMKIVRKDVYKRVVRGKAA